MEEESQKVTLTAGIINATGQMLYWKGKSCADIGEYVIVKNVNGYDLIRIVGKIETFEHLAGKFSNTKYESMKSIVMTVGKIED